MREIRVRRLRLYHLEHVNPKAGCSMDEMLFMQHIDLLDILNGSSMPGETTFLTVCLIGAYLLMGWQVRKELR
jgi:hypothetical protein